MTPEYGRIWAEIVPIAAKPTTVYPDDGVVTFAPGVFTDGGRLILA